VVVAAAEGEGLCNLLFADELNPANQSTQPPKKSSIIFAQITLITTELRANNSFDLLTMLFNLPIILPHGTLTRTTMTTTTMKKSVEILLERDVRMFLMNLKLDCRKWKLFISKQG
jgi:hypothetical protein